MEESEARAVSSNSNESLASARHCAGPRYPGIPPTSCLMQSFIEVNPPKVNIASHNE